MTDLRDRLRRRLRDPDVDGFDRDAGEEEDQPSDVPVNVDDDQPTKIEASTPHTPSGHIPVLARSFDPWGIRTSTSYDSPGFNRRWIEAMLGQQQPE